MQRPSGGRDYPSGPEFSNASRLRAGFGEEKGEGQPSSSWREGGIGTRGVLCQRKRVQEI